MNIFATIYKRKKSFAIFGAVILFAGIYLLISQKQAITPSTQISPTPSLISPTITLSVAPFTIIKTSPSNNQEFVFENSDILLTFNRKLNEDEKVSFEINSNPEAEFTKFWESNSFLRLKPVNNYKINTQYTISAQYNNSVFYFFTFKTHHLSNKQLDAQANQQMQDDLKFAETQLKYHQDYPWYKDLPIVKEKYTIVYNFDRNAFRIRIKVENPSENEKNAIINDALNDLKGIGVDTEKILYYII